MPIRCYNSYYMIFAHNGIDHATNMEAAAHQSNTLAWVLLMSVIVAFMVYIIKKSRGSQQAEEIEEDDE